MKKFFKIISLLIVIAIAVGVVTINSTGYQLNSIQIPLFNKSNSDKQTDDLSEMRALWIPFTSLDIKSSNGSFDSFKQKFDKIVSDAEDKKLNTLIVHVRPFCDALYESDIFPCSHVLSGLQGKAVDFDALEYMAKTAHKKKLKIHAWINPFRVTSNKTSFEISNKNPIKSLPDGTVLEWENGLYLDPSSNDVRKLIIDGVREIIDKYDIDGIHFDDYFYPTTSSDYDKTSYQNYVSKLDDTSIPLTLSEWRTNNVNMLINGVYNAVHSSDKDVVFGISPQGNIENDISMGADVYTWGSVSGYVDYLCPQLYVNSENPILPFDKTADAWKKLVKKDNIELYIGLGLYKAGSDVDEGTWQNADDIIKSQIEYTRKIKTDGFALYSSEYLVNKQTKAEVTNMMSVLA
ncbi:MAG: family 10 glycosylhydrolase [Clostridia bacterium]|nr:family 10 glycosylhydrolase [Clostridia bacterium]